METGGWKLEKGLNTEPTEARQRNRKSATCPGEVGIENRESVASARLRGDLFSVLSVLSLFALLLPVPCVAQVTFKGKVTLKGSVTLRIPPLSLTSLSPSSMPFGTTPPPSVTISGTSFGGVQGNSIVDFGGNQQPTITTWSNTSIGVVVPSGLAVGEVMVQVIVGGVNSNPLGFTVTPALPTGNTITLLPGSGPVGTPVTITGINFGASQGSSTVTFNGTGATPTSWSALYVLVPVPANATTGNVVVTVNSVPHSAGFTVSPLITTLTPGSGTVGTSVTVSGSNFGASQGSNTVTFNGQSAGTASSWSNASITVTVPSGAQTGPVVVTVGGYASNPVTFTVPASGLGAC
jgi:hypothetical protein